VLLLLMLVNLVLVPDTHILVRAPSRTRHEALERSTISWATAMLFILISSDELVLRKPIMFCLELYELASYVAVAHGSSEAPTRHFLQGRPSFKPSCL